MLIASRSYWQAWRLGHWAFRSTPGPVRARLHPGQCQWTLRQCRRPIFELHSGRDQRPCPAPTILDVFADDFNEKNESQHATSEDLILALKEIGEEYKTPAEFAGNVDLSYTSAFELITNQAAAHDSIAINAFKNPTGKGLKGILVRHLQFVQDHIEAQDWAADTSHHLDHLLRLTDRIQYLRRHGFSVEDLMSWAWILKAPTADRAAARFYKIASPKLQKPGDHVPVFVFMFLLRRQHFSARGVQMLLDYAWQMMEYLTQHWTLASKNSSVGLGGELPTVENDRQPFTGQRDKMDMREHIFIIMIIRLLRRARDVYPEAFESIIALFCRHLNGRNFQVKSTDTSRLSFVYNTMLSLLSVPVSSRPFVNSAHQQRAQFAVLHRMSEFKPALVVDRRGYRAVTRVQLKHKKTLREREWAMVKSPAWPPWRADKLGIHEDITLEHGISRASQSLKDAETSGYEMGTWGDAASVLAGWDKDGTPTIQFRADLGWRQPDRRKQSSDSKVWASRIRATRSPREAWAIFQNCKHQDNWSAAESRCVYLALFEKIVWVSKTDGLTAFDSQQELDVHAILPGDRPELLPDPHINTVSVSTPLPDFDTFYAQMLEDGAHLQGELLEYIVKYAPTLPMLVRILEDSNQFSQTIKAVIDTQDEINTNELRTIVTSIPRKIFESIIFALARFSKQVEVSIAETTTRYAPQMVTDPFSRALDLMVVRRFAYPKAWVALLKAASSAATIDPSREKWVSHNRVRTLDAWKTMNQILGHMDRFGVPPILDTLEEVAKVTEWAIIQAEMCLVLDQKFPTSQRLARTVIEEGVSKMKSLFIETVGKDLRRKEIPQQLYELERDVEADISKEEEQAALDESSPEDRPEMLESLEGQEEDPSGEETPETQETEQEQEDNPNENATFLPPECLLPHLLAVPHPSLLHRMVRVCGLARDYQGLLDLLDWMAVFSNELKNRASEQRNGPVMMRRCVIAVRVFLERSWEYYDIPDRERHVLLDREVGAAELEVWEMARTIVEENAWWGDWPTDDEVKDYVFEGRFV